MSRKSNTRFQLLEIKANKERCRVEFEELQKQVKRSHGGRCLAPNQVQAEKEKLASLVQQTTLLQPPGPR